MRQSDTQQLLLFEAPLLLPGNVGVLLVLCSCCAVDAFVVKTACFTFTLLTGHGVRVEAELPGCGVGDVLRAWQRHQDLRRGVHGFDLMSGNDLPSFAAQGAGPVGEEAHGAATFGSAADTFGEDEGFNFGCGVGVHDAHVAGVWVKIYFTSSLRLAASAHSVWIFN